jgi:hypothetical protein
MKINYIKRKDLDIEKYDACIEQSTQSRIYAFSWYLDIVADKWDALVLEDYKAVMPIPWKRKFGIKYVVQPYFCQQLGVFSKDEFDKGVFLKKIPKSFIKIHLNINFDTSKPSLEKRINYELDLSKDYSITHFNYRKDRKKSLKKAEKNYLDYQDFNNKINLIKLYKTVFDYLKMEKEMFTIVELIIDFSLKNNCGFIRNIFFNDELVCSGFFIKYKKRIYYIFSSSSKLGKKVGATTFILDSVIKEYSNTEYVLDFEGSTIPSIGNFYKSFGSLKTIYYTYKINALKRMFS